MESRGRARTACTLDHLPMLFRPHAGAIKFGGRSPAGTIYFVHPVAEALLTFVFRISYFPIALSGKWAIRFISLIIICSFGNSYENMDKIKH